MKTPGSRQVRLLNDTEKQTLSLPFSWSQQGGPLHRPLGMGVPHLTPGWWLSDVIAPPPPFPSPAPPLGKVGVPPRLVTPSSHRYTSASLAWVGDRCVTAG